MKKYIVGICFSMLFFTSCSDWLNVEPKTTVKEEEVFSRELGFKEALTLTLDRAVCEKFKLWFLRYTGRTL